MRLDLVKLLVRLLLKNAHICKDLGTLNEPSNAQNELKNVCFFSNTAIGDSMFNTPVWSAFRAHYPSAKIVALLHPSSASLFKNDANIDEILTYNGKWGGFFKTLKELKKRRFDAIFILHSNEPQATPLAVLSGARYIFKIPNDKNEFSAFHSNPKTALTRGQYAVKSRLQVLSFVGINANDTRMRLYLNDDDFSKANALLEPLRAQKQGLEAKIIGFQMGASVFSKFWIKDSWLALAQKLLDDGHIIVLCGSINERKFCSKISAQLANERVLNAAGLLNLRSAATLIGSLDTLISVDTGILHIAAALKTPTITLFGPTNPAELNPDFDTNIHIAITAPNAASYYANHRGKDYSYLMKEISVDMVHRALLSILQATL